MPLSRRRPEPRHLDPDRLRLTKPRRVWLGAGLALLILAATAGVGAVAVGSVPEAFAALGALRGDDRDPVTAKERPSAEAETSASPTEPTPEAAPREPYRLVESTRLRPAKQDRRKPDQPARNRLADRVEKAAAAPTIDEFGVAMINILGSNHTKGGRGGYASGANRARTATGMLLARGASIIGFSEIQSDQLGVFLGNAPTFEAYPGHALGGKGVPQSVAWDTRVWSLVEAGAIYVPFSGQIRPQPVVKLANVASGAEIWVMNVHNSPNQMEGERDRAESIEIARINELTATGLPVVVTGDFNEKQEVLCRVTASTALVSAVGGGNCYPPPQQMRVDWIFASPALSVNSYTVTREAPIPSITDHAVLFSRLSLQ